MFACDNDKEVKKSIQANHSPEVFYPDIQGRDVVSVPYVDLYVAGFPCQPFSSMGKQQGFEDPCGIIFFDILKYIETKLPKVFVLENVKGLVKLNNGKDLNRILKLLRRVRLRDHSRAYVIKHQIIDTKEQGIPQSRPRWYCVGIRKDCSEADSFTFPGIIELSLIHI